MKTVIGAFDTFGEARAAVDALERAGFNERDVSIVANNANSTVGTTDTTTTTTTEHHHSVGGETLKGAAVGGLAGLIVGLAPFVIPGLGAIAAAGWLTMTLTGAAIGAGVGLVGALMGVGVPEEEAHYYNESVRRGGTLVLVRADDMRADEAARILSDAGAIDIDERAATYRQEGWKWTPAATTTAATMPTYTTATTPVVGTNQWRTRSYNYTGEWPYTNTADTRGPLERAEDFVTGDNIDDKTGQPVKADTRGVGEKMADAITGDRVDDKTGRVVR